jgi:Predicted nucleotidyltransferase
MADLWDSIEFRSKIDEAKQRIREIADSPEKQNFKELYLMGIVTPLLDELGADPAVIVGGHAVELYTSGSYTTADIDLVMVRDDLARQLFDELGLRREGRFHYADELDVPIEIPSSHLAGSLERVVKLSTPDGYCYVIGIEDLILDRLNAAEFWQDVRSLEWARYLMASQLERVDFDYMRQKAAEEHTSLLRRLEETIEWVRRNSDE